MSLFFSDSFLDEHTTNYEIRCEHLSMQNFDLDSRLRSLMEILPKDGKIPEGAEAQTALEDIRFLLYHKFRPDWRERGKST